MKLWKLATLSTVLILTFSGCLGTSPKPSDKPVIDSTLPKVELTQNGVFVDMQAIAFEWKNIQDARVQGIYVFKQDLQDADSEYKYYDTVKSRFVTHYVDEDVEPSSKYGYLFKTFSKDSESLPSIAKVVTTLPALDSVSWIHAIENMPRSAKIIWRPHNNEIVKSYIIERRTLSEDTWDKLATVKGRLNAEYIDDKLKDNHVYKYRIRVLTYNSILSAPSQEVKATTKALPNEVVGIVATQDLPKKIKLTWEASTTADFSYYKVYRSSSVDGSYKLVKATRNLEFIDEIQEDGKDYFYRVSAVDEDELESRNEVNSVYGKTLSKPTPPSLVEAKMIGDNLHITWKSIDSRVKSFIVNKSVKRGWFDKTSEDFIDIKGNTFVDSAVEPNTTYTYEVYSVDKFSIKSEPSIEVRYTTGEHQGKVLEHSNFGKAVEIVDSPVESENQNVVVPVEDLDMSEL